MSRVLNIYNKVSKFPLGNRICSRLLTFNAPYFSTIRPLIKELREGYCSIEMQERRAIHNHIKTIHAIAMCNLCELTGGLVMEVTIPDNLRWIAKGMTVDYIKKAKGRLISESSINHSDIIPGDVKISVDIKDLTGDIVTRAVISMYVSKRKQVV